MATEQLAPRDPPRPRSEITNVIDLIVKATVVLAALLYGCGFLVISIQEFKYGLVEMNPLRPKALAAGTWFLFFIAAPFALVFEQRALKPASSEDERWLRKRSTANLLAAVSALFLGTMISLPFDIGPHPEPKGPSTGALFIAMTLSAAIVVADRWKRFPHPFAVFASSAFSVLVMFCGTRDLFEYNRLSPASIALWFLVFCVVAYVEMSSRSWVLQAGNWKGTIGAGILALGAFASLYYPHISPSWGGGAPIPATIYFRKDSPVSTGRSVSALILDETDSGFYVIGGSDKKATFIPRSEVVMVYYSDDASGTFITKAK
jgi:hypothetical protein